MAHILNMITFLKELIFGRLKTGNRTKMQIIKSCIGYAVVALSLYTNYTFIKLWYGSTARYIAVQRTLSDHKKLEEEVRELRTKVATYEGVLSSFGEYFPLPHPPEVRPGKAPPKNPTQPEHQSQLTVIIPPPRPAAVPEPDKQPLIN